jgi:hypothetical protein
LQRNFGSSIYPFAVTIVLLETSVNQEFVLGLNEKNLFDKVSGEVFDGSGTKTHKDTGQLFLVTGYS